MNEDKGQSIFFQITELHLDGKVMVEDIEITGFIIPQFINEERKHGNLDIVNALAQYIQSFGETKAVNFRDESESDKNKRVYVLRNLPKLSMLHKFYSVTVSFSVYVKNGKLLITKHGRKAPGFIHGYIRPGSCSTTLLSLGTWSPLNKN